MLPQGVGKLLEVLGQFVPRAELEPDLLGAPRQGHGESKDSLVRRVGLGDHQKLTLEGSKVLGVFAPDFEEIGPRLPFSNRGCFDSELRSLFIGSAPEFLFAFLGILNEELGRVRRMSPGQGDEERRRIAKHARPPHALLNSWAKGRVGGASEAGESNLVPEARIASGSGGSVRRGRFTQLLFKPERFIHPSRVRSRGSKVEEHGRVAGAKPSQGLILAVRVIGPAVRPVEIAETSPGPGVEGSALDDLAEHAARLFVVVLPAPKLTHRRSHPSVGERIRTELSGEPPGYILHLNI